MKISGSLTLLLLLGSVSAQETSESNPPTPSDLYAALKEMTASLVQLKADMATVQPVAFSASLAVEGELHIGPVPSDTPLIYRHVPTNIGNAYNTTTGVFTAPVRGAYHFEFHINSANSRSTAAFLVKNSENVFAAHESQPAHFMSSSNGVTLLLEVGDKVFVRLAATSHVFDNFNHHTTFSGHLLFPM
ncbi:complement C1q-like protein 4 isoform X2 [Etheostoma spectabile]|uniref:complement C1q-like protein 4 isoform X2 n=1 Tax=Etheostoma spectabile TaxID=54343 RepID=UPI0013AEDDE7|nr:complement C1q-like protein 4 isoform X2 [Etheostoma spectabile]